MVCGIESYVITCKLITYYNTNVIVINKFEYNIPIFTFLSKICSVCQISNGDCKKSLKRQRSLYAAVAAGTTHIELIFIHRYAMIINY